MSEAASRLQGEDVKGLLIFACSSSLLLLFVLLRVFLFLVRVDGWSMFPTFQDGDLLLALRCWPKRWLRRGQIVVWQPHVEPRLIAAQTPAPGMHFVKRITGLPGDRVVVSSLPGPLFRSEPGSFDTHIPQAWDVPIDHCFVQGDSPGYDSRLIGPIPLGSIRGLIILRIRRKTVPTAPAGDLPEVRWQTGGPNDS